MSINLHPNHTTFTNANDLTYGFPSWDWTRDLSFSNEKVFIDHGKNCLAYNSFFIAFFKNFIIADFDLLFVVFVKAEYFFWVHSIDVKLSHNGLAAMILCLYVCVHSIIVKWLHIDFAAMILCFL